MGGGVGGFQDGIVDELTHVDVGEQGAPLSVAMHQTASLRCLTGRECSFFVVVFCFARMILRRACLLYSVCFMGGGGLLA